MIVKERTAPKPSDKFGQAGYEAEKQMAFYLRRAFTDASDVFVFNDLRLERNGEYAQIDHLVLHRFGFAIVESKSVVGKMVVNAQGEFTRFAGGRASGMQSPIRQAKLQAELLSKLVNDYKESLRRKWFFGTQQVGFRDDRFRVFVAISDHGIIRREGCDPEELCKADTIVEKIKATIATHARASSFGGIVKFIVSTGKTSARLEKETILPLTEEELKGLQSFLLDRHEGLPIPNEARPTPAVVSKAKPSAPSTLKGATNQLKTSATQPAALNAARCRHCSQGNLVILHGPYGYYYKCPGCSGNTRTEPVCIECGGKARVTKSGREFSRACEKCGKKVLFHVNPES